MSQATTAASRKQNVWWGVGVNVESQIAVAGISAMLARMFSLTDANKNCLIRVSGVQAGPGLGGGGDYVLVIATGVATPSKFPLMKVDGGWEFSLRDVVSANDTPKACFQLARAIKDVPASELADFAVKHPSYLLKLKDAVGAFYDSMAIGADAVMKLPRLWTFPLVGIGFQLSVTYHFRNRVELVEL